MASKKGSARKRAKEGRKKRPAERVTGPWVAIADRTSASSSYTTWRNYLLDMDDDEPATDRCAAFKTRAEALSMAERLAAAGTHARIAYVTDTVDPAAKRVSAVASARTALAEVSE